MKYVSGSFLLFHGEIGSSTKGRRMEDPIEKIRLNNLHIIEAVKKKTKQQGKKNGKDYSLSHKLSLLLLRHRIDNFAEPPLSIYHIDQWDSDDIASILGAFFPTNIRVIWRQIQEINQIICVARNFVEY